MFVCFLLIHASASCTSFHGLSANYLLGEDVCPPILFEILKAFIVLTEMANWL